MKDDIPINKPKITEVNLGLFREKNLKQDILGKFLFCTEIVKNMNNFYENMEKSVFPGAVYNNS